MPNHVKNIITLKGSEKQICEMLETIKNDEALCIIGEYVNITGDDTDEDIDEGMTM